MLLILAGGGAAAIQTTQEILADKKYDAGFASVELIGVCKATETEAGCWNGDGGPAPDLEADFKTAFASADYRFLPLRYGQKTRVAVFRVTNPAYNDPRGSIESYFQSNMGNFDFATGSSGGNGEPRVEIRTAVIRAKLTDTIGQASTSIRKNAPPSARIAAKEGSKLDYLGTTYTIRKIVRTTLDPLVYSSPGANRWILAMTAEAAERRPVSVGWVAIDDAGLVIRVVDKDGNPVIADPSVLNNLGNPNFPNPNPRTSTPKIFEARFQAGTGYGQMTGDDYPIYTNINPAKIKAIYAYGSSSQKLTITGIPLEPSTK